jgi:hypothetical protein
MVNFRATSTPDALGEDLLLSPDRGVIFEILHCLFQKNPFSMTIFVLSARSQLAFCEGGCLA